MGDVEFFAMRGSVDNARELVLHRALDHHDELVGVVGEILPALPRRIDPELARETTGGPVSGDALTIDLRLRHRSRPAS